MADSHTCKTTGERLLYNFQSPKHGLTVQGLQEFGEVDKNNCYLTKNRRKTERESSQGGCSNRSGVRRYAEEQLRIENANFASFSNILLTQTPTWDGIRQK